ncbi:Zn(2)-C6 fungal-type domain-containing protein [Mycena chlorophos]|uniref:Zn(2)-C6 fungal-type domain-containing protein n=1 Tax=Mycena chlorophos TaxID=658473 RepID=A0A8H6W7R9_MYCCL|nr:Zn(2)-C6 fungal-type domain-containing protein [Mycena chlorophos]
MNGGTGMHRRNRRHLSLNDRRNGGILDTFATIGSALVRFGHKEAGFLELQVSGLPRKKRRRSGYIGYVWPEAEARAKPRCLSLDLRLLAAMAVPRASTSPLSPTFTLFQPNEADEYPDIPNRSSSPLPMDTGNGNGNGNGKGRRMVDLDRTIPPADDPTRQHRTLVLCFDGTGDQFDDDNSNVVNLFAMLQKDDPSRQLVYYQAGIGTYTIPEIAHPWMAKVHRTVDMMLGSHLNAHVMGGYEFLMQNYRKGDKICLFGFSRGAYTARALAGMLHKVGLLPKNNHQQVAFAYRMYSREDEDGWRQSTAFKKSFSIDVDVEFLGVWDTVSSVGFIPQRLPFTRSNTHVKYFRHAIALDEHRARFLPNFWQRRVEGLASEPFGVGRGEMPKSRVSHKKQDSESGHFDPKKESHKSRKTLRELEREYSDSDRPTHVEEVWFAGAHCDVGGGAAKNGTRNYLARIPMRWMIRQCFALNTGIVFHADMLRLVGLEPDMLYPHVRPRPPPVLPSHSPTTSEAPSSTRKKWSLRRSTRSSASTSSSQVSQKYKSDTVASRAGTIAERTDDFVNEEEEDLADAMCDINDELKLAPAWWILELIPQQLRYQDHNQGEIWVKKLMIHRAKGRHIPRQTLEGVKLHRTVKMRMDAMGYEPKAKLKQATERHWVD